MRAGIPKGDASINFKGNQYSLDYKVGGKPKNDQMDVFVPKVVEKTPYPIRNFCKFLYGK
jgi:hypothetical protein